MSNVSEKKPIQLCKLSDLAVGECCRIHQNDCEGNHWIAQKNKKPYKIKAGIYQKVFVKTKSFQYKFPFSYQTFLHIKTGEVIFIPTQCECEKIFITMKTEQGY